VTLSLIHNYSLQFTTDALLFLVSCPTPVLWYRLPTAHVPLPRFRNYPRPTATIDFFTHWKSIFGALSNNCLLLKLKPKLSCDWQSVGQSISVSDSHLELLTRFFFLSDNCGSVHVGRPLWREDESVITRTIASGLCQSCHIRFQVPQNSRPYFTVSFAEQSRTESRYDWGSVGQSVGQSVSQTYVLVSSPLWACDHTLFPVWRFLSENLSLWGALSDERSGLSLVSLYEH
jgi:hypothetical protein